MNFYMRVPLGHPTEATSKALSLPQSQIPLEIFFLKKKQFFNQCHLVTTRLLQHYLNTLPLITTLTLESKGLLCLPRPSCLTHTTFGGKPILPTANTYHFGPLLHDLM